MNAVRRTVGRLALTVVATSLIAACAATRALEAAGAARGVDGATAMLYLPAGAGRPATILPYDLGRGRGGTSAAGLLRRRAEAADVQGHPTGDRPCGEEGCLVTKPQVYRLAATPAAAISRALMLIRDHLPISKEALESGLGASESATGEQVVVGVQVESYICGMNGEAIPPDLLLPVRRPADHP
jgi:hypothetical protein